MWTHASFSPFTALRAYGDHSSITDVNKSTHVQHSCFLRKKMFSSCLGGSLPLSIKMTRKKKSAQSSRSMEFEREQRSRVKLAFPIVAKIFNTYTYVFHHLSTELGSHHRPNQNNLQAHSHTQAELYPPKAPHCFTFNPFCPHYPLAQRLESGEETKHTPTLTPLFPNVSHY